MPQVTRITIGRLYNLGNYEHIRYELTSEIHPSEQPSIAMIGMERILAALNPKCPTDICSVEIAEYRLKTFDATAWERMYGQDWEKEAAALKKNTEAKRAEIEKWKALKLKAHALLDDLGGASEMKDAKLDWDPFDDREES